MANLARGGGFGHNLSLVVDVQEQQTVQVLRPCRIIIGVDVSYSMEDLIDGVINGIGGINSALNDKDLVSVVDFAMYQKTIFPYLKRWKVNWDDLGDRLRSDLRNGSRGDGTALWDAIGYILETTPRNAKFKEYKPELIIFTDGEDNSSVKHSQSSIREALRNPGIAHVHITVIDAYPRSNYALREICGEAEHCSYVRVHASKKAIERAFVDVIAAVHRRLTVSVQGSSNSIDALTSSLNRLGIGPRMSLAAVDGGNTESGDEARSRGRGRGRGRGQGRGRGRGRRHGRGGA
ncbi:hypothetical protein ACRALDRAFT_1061855 [Sodiomyces alcalophilus JCM 7366]|uniref:uncharacterized protein n=1 Tax=Sodiomyces alcalophilus JCM 7366 TaxID=591952 RepID=UPI0039B48CAA